MQTVRRDHDAARQEVARNVAGLGDPAAQVVAQVEHERLGAPGPQARHVGRDGGSRTGGEARQIDVADRLAAAVEELRLGLGRSDLAPRERDRADAARAARAQVGVKPQPARMPDDFRHIGAQQRFAAGKIRLHDTQSRRLSQNALPFFRAQFTGVAGKIERVAAIRALERATISQLAKQGEWARRFHVITHSRRQSLFPPAAVKCPSHLRQSRRSHIARRAG